MESEETNIESKTVKVNLMGIKRMKATHVWRLEFDVYEEDSYKVKAFMDKIDGDFHMLLVPIDNKPDNS